MNTYDEIGERLINVIIKDNLLYIKEHENNLILSENIKMQLNEKHRLLVVSKHLYSDGHEEIKVQGYEDLPFKNNEDKFHRDVQYAINNVDHNTKIPLVISQLTPSPFTGLLIANKF